MKILFSYLIGTALLMLASTTTLSSQDWNKINPEGVKTLADTTLMRAVVVTIEPGKTIGPVTHPAYFAYVLQSGKVKVSHEEGEPLILDLNAGMAFFSDPEGPHRTQNIGEQPISFLLVELKEHPYKKHKK